MQWSKEETKINVRPLNRGHEYGDGGDEGDDVVALHNGDDGWKS